MKTRGFSQELKQARAEGYAVGAFNILNDLTSRSIIRAAEEADCPLILQTSVATVKKFGIRELGLMLRTLSEEAKVNVLVHLDHCTDLSFAKACVDTGCWDAVMYDGSKLPLEENLKNCLDVVEYAHARGVQVEGELGKIMGVEEEIKVTEADATHATYEESLYFVRESGVDALAPAIGTAHGVYKGVPKINFDLVSRLKDAMDTPVVIHGGTGLSEETFLRLIRCGGCKVNVSTAIKHAYLDAAKAYFEVPHEKVDPLGFDRILEESVQRTAAEHIAIFTKERVR